MIIATLVAASLAMPVAADPGAAWPPAGSALPHLSAQQKHAVIRPLVETANQCIARKVTTDPRYSPLAQAGEINGLIVDSVPSCVDAMRALIDAHDRLFGDGAGETYFMGPYLDALPAAVQKYLNNSR
jgi:hypothetical protein